MNDSICPGKLDIYVWSRYVLSKCPYAHTSLYPKITTHNIHIITLCVYIYLYIDIYVYIYIYIPRWSACGYIQVPPISIHVSKISISGSVSTYWYFPVNQYINNFWCLYMFLSFHPPVRPSFPLPTYLQKSFNPSIHVNVSISSSIQIPTDLYLCIYRPIDQSIHPSIRPSIRQSIHLNNYLFVHLSIYPPSSIRLI